MGGRRRCCVRAFGGLRYADEPVAGVASLAVTTQRRDIEAQRLAALGLIDRGPEIIGVRDLAALYFGDDVALGEHFTGGGDFLDAGHDNPSDCVLEFIVLANLRSEALY